MVWFHRKVGQLDREQAATCAIVSVFSLTGLTGNFGLGQSDQKQAGSKSIANLWFLTCICVVWSCMSLFAPCSSRDYGLEAFSSFSRQLHFK